MAPTPKKIKITRIPGTDVIGPVWEIPEIPEEMQGRVNFVEPAMLTIHNEDGTDTSYLVKDMPTEEHPGLDIKDYTRAAWKANGGYPPGRIRMRPAAFPGEPLEARMTPEPAKWRPSPALARRKKVVEKLGAPLEKQLLQAEEDLEREDFARWLEERRLRGPG